MKVAVLYALGVSLLPPAVSGVVPVEKGHDALNPLASDGAPSRPLLRHEASTAAQPLSARTSTRLAKTALLQQSEVSSRESLRWDGQIVYAIFTSGIPKYHNAMLAQLDTWAAKPFAEKRLVAMGGRNYPKEWQVEGSIMPSDCEDHGQALACKERALIVEAATRGAAWVVLLGEDNWMNTTALDGYLKKQDADTPQALGLLGCGRTLGRYCKEVDEQGGLCGGGTYAISRAALKKLMSDGASKLTAEYSNTTWPNDMMTSCALRRRNISLNLLPHLHGAREIKDQTILDLAQQRFSLHNIDEPTMRWIHASTSGSFEKEQVERRHEAAFYKGCVRSLNGSSLQALKDAWNQCTNTSGHV